MIFSRACQTKYQEIEDLIVDAVDAAERETNVIPWSLSHMALEKLAPYTARCAFAGYKVIACGMDYLSTLHNRVLGYFSG